MDILNILNITRLICLIIDGWGFISRSCWIFLAQVRRKNELAVVMAQLVDRSFPLPEVCSSNPVIGKNLYWTFTVNCIEKKEWILRMKKHTTTMLLSTSVLLKAQNRHLIKWLQHSWRRIDHSSFNHHFQTCHWH